MIKYIHGPQLIPEAIGGDRPEVNLSRLWTNSLSAGMMDLSKRGDLHFSQTVGSMPLDQLDKELERRGLNYVRYADDFSIYTRSKTSAREIGNAIYLFLRDKLELPINREKSGIRRPSIFKLLGYGFVPKYKKGARGTYQLVAKKSSWDALERKLKRITKKTLGHKLEYRLSQLKLVWQGWLNNYRIANIYTKLKQLDEWLRNRLRYYIWHN